MTPTLYMLIGVPGSGKTTWIRNHGDASAVVVSTDNLIEEWASWQGWSYNFAFEKYINKATTEMNRILGAAVRERANIIWDQTNTTRKSRKGKLSRIPKDYRKVAIFFPVPADLKERLASRPGKTIPESVMLNMINQLEPPAMDEGFDEIIHAG